MITASTLGSDYRFYIPNDPKNIKNRDEHLLLPASELILDNTHPLRFIAIHTMG